MLEIIIWLIFAGFAFIGIIDVIRALEEKIMSTKIKKYVTCVYPVKGSIEDQDELIRVYLNRIKWSTNDNENTFVILDMGLDEQAVHICEKVCSDYDGVLLLKPEELMAILSGKVNTVNYAIQDA